MKLDNFNSLPPKPEHLKKVLALLRIGNAIRLSDIVSATGFSKTQVLCALDLMVRNGQVVKEKSSSTFRSVGELSKK